jgi:acylphosphatase
VRRRYLVEGLVQGVGFRYFARREALRLGIVGWVRNSVAGHVEVLAEGGVGAVEEFEAAIRRGPRSASVTNLRILETVDEEPEARTFEITD